MKENLASLFHRHQYSFPDHIHVRVSSVWHSCPNKSRILPKLPCSFVQSYQTLFFFSIFIFSWGIIKIQHTFGVVVEVPAKLYNNYSFMKLRNIYDPVLPSLRGDELKLSCASRPRFWGKADTSDRVVTLRSACQATNCLIEWCDKNYKL